MDSRDRTRWLGEARFGLFVHWGLYATHGRGEQVLFREHLTPSAYRASAATFNPWAYNPREWPRWRARRVCATPC